MEAFFSINLGIHSLKKQVVWCLNYMLATINKPGKLETSLFFCFRRSTCRSARPKRLRLLAVAEAVHATFSALLALQFILIFGAPTWEFYRCWWSVVRSWEGQVGKRRWQWKRTHTRIFYCKKKQCGSMKTVKNRSSNSTFTKMLFSNLRCLFQKKPSNRLLEPFQKNIDVSLVNPRGWWIAVWCFCSNWRTPRAGARPGRFSRHPKSMRRKRYKRGCLKHLIFSSVVNLCDIYLKHVITY